MKTIEQLETYELFKIAYCQVDPVLYDKIQDLENRNSRWDLFVSIFGVKLTLWLYRSKLLRKYKWSFSWLKDWFDKEFAYEIKTIEDYYNLRYAHIIGVATSEICDVVLREFINWNLYLETEPIYESISINTVDSITIAREQMKILFKSNNRNDLVELVIATPISNDDKTKETLRNLLHQYQIVLKN